MAIPIISKPHPRFAIDAGTNTVTSPISLFFNKRARYEIILYCCNGKN